jgi:hypothetical protein
MGISRTTVQGMYDEARRKLAESLVNGRVLFIEGGEYRLCEGGEPGCGGGNCWRHRCGRGFEEDLRAGTDYNKIRMEDSNENSDTGR